MIFNAVGQMAKGMETLAHTVTLLTAENKTLRKANEALSKRRRAKKTRLRQGGALSVEDAQDMLARRDAEAQAKADKRSGSGAGEAGPSTSRRCGNCGKTGHNVRTCQAGVETSEEPSDE